MTAPLLFAKGAIFMRKYSILRLSTDAMLCAMCAVLGYLAIDLTTVKITFESLPIFLAAIMFGPVDGLAVGAVGTLIYQLLRYGFSATTLLWMFPYILLGLLIGLFAKYHHFRPERIRTLIVVTIGELLVTALNTGVIYADSKIYGYYYPMIILGSLAFRLITSLAKGILFGIALPPLITAIRRGVPGVANPCKTQNK